MAALPKPRPEGMTETEYLDYERASETKHEYYDGEIFAMSGASRGHNLISGNLMVAFKTQLRGKGCEVYPADMRVKIPETGLFTYPDLSVMCGEAQFADDTFDTLLNPVVIVEILSPSTESYDRGKKFQHYREIPSLREYVLVAQDSPRIEYYHRRDDGGWEFTDAAGLDATLTLASVGVTLALAEVYEQVTFTE